MRFALFLGCKIPSFAPQYETSARVVLKKLGFEIAKMEFNCCGYPMRNDHFHLFILAAARNLALAEAKGLPMMTLCKCCLGTLKRAQNFLAQDPELLTMVKEKLALEGLEYRGSTEVRHLQSVLHQDVGLERLSDLVTHPFENLKVATMYGCHALRPSRITGFDNAYTPHVIEDLLQVVGAQSVPWAGRLKCCGAPLRERNEDLSLATIKMRMDEWAESGAEALNVDCPHTLLQIKWAQETLGAQSGEPARGVVLYPQLLGLALGLSASKLALEQNAPSPAFLTGRRAPAPGATKKTVSGGQ
ncbi:MAG: CoB--CoM heterodisulfide reductase iron-sulfur subunit B family protein [Proteobacteria bacterium]|nr:CoB--CoM heterodisulfide reductase iron-sulfur subunit B family protein [Pseudomonadota bacterium]MBU1451399.1 CoB--CoM heterodisulfide reductase iron-sulfur subunit B family protein [Pseudomonadota bacterium]MBU2468015.1 CoB--CoM heterodisulfide reductase iron-sulfur subunit B family protein [Pseudomonadota bacterium]MBU2517529.1 CoB--CoM heterodisulfide reductase iron-sulfur subunit B family protein [Pseudomonadota bacterium]